MTDGTGDADGGPYVLLMPVTPLIGASGATGYMLH